MSVLKLLVLPGDGIGPEVTREAVAIGPSVGVTIWKGLAIEARLAGELVANNAPRGISAGLGVSWRMPSPEDNDVRREEE